MRKKRKKKKEGEEGMRGLLCPGRGQQQQQERTDSSGRRELSRPPYWEGRRRLLQ